MVETDEFKLIEEIQTMQNEVIRVRKVESTYFVGIS